MTILLQSSFLEWIRSLQIISIIDLLIVAYIVYRFYKIVRGTSAFNISLTILGIYIFWFIAGRFSMPLTTGILDKITSMGVLALVVLFQPEIRRFLFLVGTKGYRPTSKKRRFFRRFFKVSRKTKKNLNFTPIIQACMHLSASKTGALIILSNHNSLPYLISTGESVQAKISSALIENIFYKNSPLHDGAVIIDDNKIMAARCILPVTSNKNISEDLGLRHRSAIGATEQTDALAIVVSEQTGSISYCSFGDITYNVSPSQLRDHLHEEFEDINEE